MSNPKGDRESRLRATRKALHEAEGGERLKLFLEYDSLVDEDPAAHEWMSPCFPHIKLHSWSTENPHHPRVVFTYTVQRNNCNRMGNLHGGCTSTIFDWTTSMPLALINKPGFWFRMGVTRTLNVTCLKPIPCGEKILIECELVSIGKTLCTIRGLMRRESDGVVLAACEHGKYNSDPPVKASSKL